MMFNNVLDKLQHTGHRILSMFQRTGIATLFLLQILKTVPGVFLRPALIIKQLYATGVQTLVIILVAGCFVGMVMALQSYYVLVDFGAEESISQMVVLSLMRELGPVIAALLFAGRAGSALTAEIGLMKSTEQLSGMEMMAVDPFERVMAPRLLSGFISMPLLAVIFVAVGVLGGYVVAVFGFDIYEGVYWSIAQAKVDLYTDLVNGIIKSIVFGFVVVWIAVFEGYDSVPTSEGLGQATTRTVVHSSLAVLGLDFILTAIMFGDI